MGLMFFRRLLLDDKQAHAFLCGCFIGTNHYILVQVVRVENTFTFGAFDSLGELGFPSDAVTDQLSAQFER